MPHELTAPVAGTVAAITEPGRHVPAGAPVVVIESMKMEYEVVAAAAGEVVSVDVTPGDLVAENQPLALLRGSDPHRDPAPPREAAARGGSDPHMRRDLDLVRARH